VPSSSSSAQFLFIFGGGGIFTAVIHHLPMHGKPKEKREIYIHTYDVDILFCYLSGTPVKVDYFFCFLLKR
jgi:hypothetical protein